jgi:hypothetical protein
MTIHDSGAVPVFAGAVKREAGAALFRAMPAQPPLL